MAGGVFRLGQDPRGTAGAARGGGGTLAAEWDV